MKQLWRMMHNYQESNVEQKGIKFTEEDFTELFDETVKTGIEYINDVRTATVKGMLIGATSTGLVGLGVWGINKFRKRNLTDGGKGTGEPGKKAGKTEVITINGKTKVVKNLSGRDRDDLEGIINEINEHKTVH